MGIEKIETPNCQQGFEETIQTAGVPGIRRIKSHWAASGSSAGVNCMTNQFSTENTVIFDQLVRSLKRDADNVLQYREWWSQVILHGRRRERNSFMDKRRQNGSQEQTGNRYANETRDNRTAYMPSCYRHENGDDSRSGYAQIYGSRERQPKQQNYRLGCSHLPMTEDTIAKNKNFNSRNEQNRSESLYQNRQKVYIFNYGRRCYNNKTK